jgi:hypothetical protein
MEPEGPLPSSQDSAIGLYPEQDKSNLHTLSYLSIIHLYVILLTTSVNNNTTNNNNTPLS